MIREEIERYFKESKYYTPVDHKRWDDEASYYAHNNVSVRIDDSSITVIVDTICIRANLGDISWSQEGVLNITGTLTL